MKPMYNVDDILARLQNGEKLEDIGNELANAMNAAQEKYVAIQKAEEEKRAAEAEKARQAQIKAQRTATRRELLWDVLDTIRQYANYTDYAAIVNNWVTEITDEDVAELDAQIIELFKTFEVLSQLNFDFNIKSVANKQPAVQKDTKKVAAVDPNKALGDFIKMMGW
jgi:small-conductance mechanosensitive channel